MSQHVDFQSISDSEPGVHKRSPRCFIVLTVLLLLAGVPMMVTAQDRAGFEPDTDSQGLEDLLVAGLTGNPAILAAQARWEAAVHDIIVRRALPDPTLGYGHYLESVETRVGPQRGAVNVTQRLPWLGKLRLDGKLAELNADMLYHQFIATAQAMAARIEEAYWSYYYLLQVLEITEQNLILMRNWEQVAFSKYTAAQAGHPDILRAQVEVLNLEDRLLSLQQRQRPLLERLSALVGTQITATSLSMVKPRIRKHVPGADSLITNLRQQNPNLLRNGTAVHLQQVMVRRAKLNYLPDLSIGVNRIFTGANPMLDANDPDNGKDPFMLSFGLTLPIHFKKYKSLEESARIGNRSAELAEQDLENRLRSQLELILFELEDAARKARLYEEALIPMAEQALLTSEKAYIGDTVDFLTIIEAQRVLLNYQLSYQQALVEQASQQAQLKALMGRYVINTLSNEE